MGKATLKTEGFVQGPDMVWRKRSGWLTAEVRMRGRLFIARISSSSTGTPIADEDPFTSEAAAATWASETMAWIKSRVTLSKKNIGHAAV